MNYNNIIIEKKETDVKFENPVKVFLNHNYSECLGKVELRIEDNILIGDFNLIGCGRGLYPSMGFALKGKDKIVHNIGLCTGINQDETIEPIK